MTAAAVLFSLIPLGLAGDGDALREAREQFLTGNYEGAESAYRRLAAEPATRIEAHVAWTDVDEQRGRYREAIERLRSVESDGGKSSDWHAALASMLARVGEYEAAIEHGRKALELSEDNCKARDELGGLLEKLGRREEAVEVYAWFERLLQDHLPERAEDLTHAGRGFYRYSVLTRHENLKDRCKYVLQEVFQEAFDFVDSKYWPARQAAADLLLEKHNTNEASDDFKKILEMNPKATDAYVGLAVAALEDWNFDEIEDQAGKALEINPNSVKALMALGRCRMLERKYGEAERVAGRMLAVNPRSIDGLSLLAVAQLRQEKRTESAATIARLEKIVPKSAALHFELAFWLSAARQYHEADEHFQKAIEADPTWVDPRTELGLMYMQSGDEPGARRVLEASWNLDSFNHQTFNVLELLDELEKFARHTIPNFLLQYDAEQDAVIVPFFSKRLGEVYADVTKEFAAVPTTQTAIEVFPSHSRFSVRIAGRPWIATVGACTGPVIAMDAPRKTGAMSTFNWAGVLRHEFTHTVTLAATGNRIPHWMTEGMAVYSEHTPRSWNWVLLLTDAMRSGRMFNLQTIDWGFMRPRRRTDRNLAYAQSEWMIEYIVERWGHEKMVGLLKPFADRKTQEQAFESVLGISTAQFDRDFAAWARTQAEAWRVPLDPLGERRSLEIAARVRPFDADARSRLAERALLEGDLKDAAGESTAALNLSKGEARAIRTRAITFTLIADLEKDDEAREHAYAEASEAIDRFAESAPNDPDSVRCQAMRAQCGQDWEKAAERWRKYETMRPADPDGFRRLAGVFLVTDNQEEALVQLEKLYALTQDEPDVCRQIATIRTKKGEDALAAEWLERLIDIDPYDGEAHRELGGLYERLNRTADAETHYKALSLLEKDRGDGHRLLAALYRKAGRTREADEQDKLANDLPAAPEKRSSP